MLFPWKCCITEKPNAYNFDLFCFATIYSLDVKSKRYISFDAIYIFSSSCSYTCDVMKRHVLIGSRLKEHQTGCDQQLTHREDRTNLATVGTS